MVGKRDLLQSWTTLTTYNHHPFFPFVFLVNWNGTSSCCWVHVGVVMGYGKFIGWQVTSWITGKRPNVIFRLRISFLLSRRRRWQSFALLWRSEQLWNLLEFCYWRPLQEDVYPATRIAHAQIPEDATRWKTIVPVIQELKVKARKLGLWNLFLSKAHYPKHGVPLTNLEVCLTMMVTQSRFLIPMSNVISIVCRNGRDSRSGRPYGFRGSQLCCSWHRQHG